MKRAAKMLAGFLGVCSIFAVTARAHRLDEYLQASRLLIAKDHVAIEMDLTPGIDVAPFVFSLINKDHDGQISESEGRAYANQVLNELVLEMDGHREKLALVNYEFPNFEQMRTGEGPIRIEALAKWRGVTGDHSLFYQNNHQSRFGVYLVNALRPESDIEITKQDRDSRQREMRLSFTIK